MLKNIAAYEIKSAEGWKRNKNHDNTTSELNTKCKSKASHPL